MNSRIFGESFRPGRRIPSSRNDSPPSSPLVPSNRSDANPDTSSETISILKGHRSSRRPPSRVITMFEEIEVEKAVMTEEWDEELECGICSHVLGAPQALVPCGHTFCGPCASQWISSSKNHTCPHCRMEVLEGTPYVPNIIVDQIIERKLRALPDGPQKMDMLVDRQEKTDVWKLRLARLATSKLANRRPRGLDDIMMNILDYSVPSDRSEVHRRRASRHFAELGAPLLRPQARSPPQHEPAPFVDRNIDDVWQSRIEEEAPSSFAAPRVEVRRMRDHMLGESTGGLTPLPEENESEIPARREVRPRGGSNMGGPRLIPVPENMRLLGGPLAPQVNLRSPSGTTHAELSHNSNVPAAQHRPSDPPVIHFLGRPTPLRSTILAARQARGRSRTSTSGSRDHPHVILSDSD